MVCNRWRPSVEEKRRRKLFVIVLGNGIGIHPIPSVASVISFSGPRPSGLFSRRAGYHSLINHATIIDRIGGFLELGFRLFSHVSFLWLPASKFRTYAGTKKDFRSHAGACPLFRKLV
jgi:hypothetical protein